MINTTEKNKSAQIISCGLNFAQRHVSKYTGFIHYKSRKEQTRDLIPITENILYAICLIKSLSREKAEKGFSQLERLFAFCTENGFVSNLHEYPAVFHDSTNVNVFIALHFFIEEFYSLIPKSVSIKIMEIKDHLQKVLENRELKGLDKKLFEAVLSNAFDDDEAYTSVHDVDRVLLVKLLLGESLDLSFHKPLNAYIGPLQDTYYDGESMTTTLSMFLSNPTDEDKVSLYAALLPKKFDWDKISYPIFDRDDLYVNNQDGLLSIHFDNSSIWAKGKYEVFVDGDHIEISTEAFEECAFFFSINKDNTILVEDSFATNFASTDTLTFNTKEKSLKVTFKCDQHDFTGILMRGNRDNQLIETRDFVFFDHKIFLRKLAEI